MQGVPGDRNSHSLPLRAPVLAAMFALFLFAPFLVPLACRRAQSLSTVDDCVHEYLRLVVSLGERDPDSLDFYFGPESLVSEERRNPPKLGELHLRTLSLRERVCGLHPVSAVDAERAAFLLAQLDALALRSQQLAGVNLPFDAESYTFFGVIAPVDQASSRRNAIRNELAGLLQHNDNLAHVYTTYDAKFVVRRDKVPALMDEALRQCRAKTLQHIALPASEHVDVSYVFHKPWSAFSRYRGHAHTLIQVNMDYPLTVDRVLDLACHEGYPGHHVFNTLRDQALVQAGHRDEWLAQPTFSPQSFVSEAAASYAPTLAFQAAERLQIERDVLFPLAGLNPRDAEHYLHVQQLVNELHTAQPGIARDYLDGRLEFVRAADALERETLMEHSETLLMYLNEYRTYMLAYTLGNDQIRTYITQGAPDNSTQWERYKQLMSKAAYSIPNPTR
jgi:hypothetical protein